MTESRFSFETGMASDTGKVREANEDSFFADGAGGIWVVADGMGGHANGRLASSMVATAAASIGQAASAADLLDRFRDRMQRVNKELQDMAEASGNSIMGSTVAALLIHGKQWTAVWSGDSRLYLVRGGRITQLSRDHTEAEDLLARGLLSREEAKHWPRRNVITRAIGVFEQAELDTVQGTVRAGDRFVLCSDGLTGHVTDPEIRDIVIAGPPQQACDRLIGLTLDRGAVDNVSVLVISCLPASHAGSAGGGLHRQSGDAR